MVRTLGRASRLAIALIFSAAVSSAAVPAEWSGRLYTAPPADPAEREALAHAQAAQPGLIRLQAVAFDPLRDGEPDFGDLLPRGPALRLVADRYRLVQFDSKASAALQRSLSARGVEIVGYVPNRAFILRLPPSGSDELLQSLGLRFVGRVAPGYKLAPDLFPLIRDPTRAAAVSLVDVFLFAGEDPGLLAAAVGHGIEGARVSFVEHGSRPRIELELPLARLPAAVGSLVNDPAVQYVARSFPLELHNDNAVWIGQSYDRVNGPGEAQTAVKTYALSATVWNRGLTGAGQIVAVADTGLEDDMCFFADPGTPVLPQTVAPPGALVLQPGHRKILALNAPQASSYSTEDSFRHGTHTTGSVAGDSTTTATAAGAGSAHGHGDGMAPGAKIVFEDVSGSVSGECSTGIVVPSLVNLLEQEYGAGARISSNSWGSSGSYSGYGRAADVACWAHEDLLLLFSAGNGGGNAGGGLNGSAACKNCLAVGASENFDPTWVDAFGILDPENMTNFSSRGPTADGRIKPDVVAPGHFVHSASFPVQHFESTEDPACDAGDPNVCFPDFGGCYVTDPLGTCNTNRLLGTSMSTPVTAGLAALARQYFTEGFYPSGAASPPDARAPSAALLKAVLINGARNMTGHRYERRGTPMDFGPLADAPSNTQGWGRVMLDDGLYFAGDERRLQVIDIPNASGLSTGETIRTQLAVTAPGQPLKLTLVWNDPPGQAMASGALINDLDLELAAPDGRIYRGNQWTADDLNTAGDRESLPNAPGRDAVNNVEGVLLEAAPAGVYTVRVIAHDVPGAQGVFTQGAALVTTGTVERCTLMPPPQSLTVQDFSSGQVVLGWDPVPGASGYTIYRNSSACGDPQPAAAIISVPAAPTTYTDTNVQPLEVYHYTVRAVVSASGCETADSACVSALAANEDPPPPVPDGTNGAPLRVGKGPLSRLVLEWDAQTCPAEGYHVLYGPLGGVDCHEITGALCSPGTTGSFSWFGVPPGDLWLLVVGESGDLIEGDWGEQSSDAPRGDGNPSGECGMLVRDDSASCP